MIQDLIKHQYVTHDGNVYDSNKEARMHELMFVYKDLIKNIECIEIDGYSLFKVNNVDELDALYFDVNLFDYIGAYGSDKEFPCLICRVYENNHYDFYLIDELAKVHQELIYKLKKELDKEAI